MKAVNSELHHQKNCSYVILNRLPRIVKITDKVALRFLSLWVLLLSSETPDTNPSLELTRQRQWNTKGCWLGEGVHL